MNADDEGAPGGTVIHAGLHRHLKGARVNTANVSKNTTTTRKKQGTKAQDALQGDATRALGRVDRPLAYLVRHAELDGFEYDEKTPALRGTAKIHALRGTGKIRALQGDEKIRGLLILGCKYARALATWDEQGVMVDYGAHEPSSVVNAPARPEGPLSPLSKAIRELDPELHAQCLALVPHIGRALPRSASELDDALRCLIRLGLEFHRTFPRAHRIMRGMPW
jgi:hypothetical protein